MSINPAISGDKRIRARLKNQNLQTRVLDPTPENKKRLDEYNHLANDVNDIPSRILGLRMNYRKRDIPAQVQRLLDDRETKIERLMELEKILFPKDHAETPAKAA